MATFTITTTQNEHKQRVYSFSNDRHISMCVYKITNIVNGKAYIGQSKNAVAERWRNHCNKLNTSTSAIGFAIKKYGISNFKFEVIGYCKSLEELNNVEKMLINLEGSMYPNGYNLHTGGNSHTPSYISRARMKASACKRFGVVKSKADIKRDMTAEEKEEAYKNRIEKMRQSKIGMPSFRKGKKLNTEHVEKMRASKIGKEVPLKWKKIVSSSGVIYDSIKHAVEQIGCNRATLMKHLKGKLNTVYGNTYSYLAQEV